MDSIEWAAAWFDAEGWVGHGRVNNELRLTFSNADIEIMGRWMVVAESICSGHMARSHPEGRRSAQFAWHTSGPRAVRLLEAFEPYLSQRRLQSRDWALRKIAVGQQVDEHRLYQRKRGQRYRKRTLAQRTEHQRRYRRFGRRAVPGEGQLPIL